MFIDFQKGQGLVPAIIQDFHTRKVLMLGYMNAEALSRTEKEKRVWFYSRSRSRLWLKGESSGRYLILKQISSDCDGDALLVEVEPLNYVCHLDKESCFYD